MVCSPQLDGCHGCKPLNYSRAVTVPERHKTGELIWRELLPHLGRILKKNCNSLKFVFVLDKSGRSPRELYGPFDFVKIYLDSALRVR